MATKKRALLVVSRAPWAGRRGDQLRALQTVELLSPSYLVTLLAPAASPHERARAAAHRNAFAATVDVVEYPRRRAALVSGLLRALVTGQPLQNGLFDQPSLRQLAAEHAAHADVVVLQLSRLAGLVPALSRRPLVVDLIDSLALNLRRRAAVDSHWRRPVLAWEVKRLERCEAALVAQTARTLLVAERDRNDLATRVPTADAGRISVVPLAFASQSEPPDAPSPAKGEPPRIVLTGNLGYFPNSDAAHFVCAELAPALAAAGIAVQLVLIGDRPPGWLAKQAAAARVELITAPLDLRAELRTATIALAPLRCGSGQPIKILEAWSCGVPVIASAWAAAGTSGQPGIDHLVAASTGEWVEAIRRLLTDPEERQRLVNSARRRLAADYGPQPVAAAWETALAAAIEHANAQRKRARAGAVANGS